MTPDEKLAALNFPEAVAEFLRLAEKTSDQQWWWSDRNIDEDGYVYIPQGSYLGNTIITLGDTYEGAAHDCDFIAFARNFAAQYAGELSAIVKFDKKLREEYGYVTDKQDYITLPEDE